MYNCQVGVVVREELRALGHMSFDRVPVAGDHVVILGDALVRVVAVVLFPDGIEADDISADIICTQVMGDSEQDLIRYFVRSRDRVAS